MMPIERQRQIVETLSQQGRVLVVELAERCLVSQETIRRDLTLLEKKGLLHRSYGGAVIATHSREIARTDAVNGMNMTSFSVNV